MNNLSNEAYNELIQYAIDYLKDTQPSCYGCDLHNEIFNSAYYIIGRHQAEQWLIKHIGIFNAIDEIKEYEESNFGEVNTDLSDSERVVNMIVYIIGEEILNESEILRDNWDNHLDDEAIEGVINDLTELL